MSISIIGSSPVTVTERELFYNTGSSGGSQTAVVANPTGEATTDLEKLQVGDTIYSVGGTGGGVLVVNLTVEGNETTLDKTWKQIYDADFAVIISEDDGKYYDQITHIYEDSDAYIVTARTNGTFTANSENGYPVQDIPT